jgi:hypothetical protein
MTSIIDSQDHVSYCLSDGSFSPDFSRLFEGLGLTLAGVIPMERGLAPVDAHWFSRDRVLRTKSVWWMDQGLASALWELEVRRLGPFAASSLVKV